MKSLPILLISSAAALSGAAGCKKTVKTADVESWIKQRTDQLGLANAKVTCPKNIEAKQGTTFECGIELGGKSFALVATITSVGKDKANFDTKWKDGEAVISAKLEGPLADELGTTFGTKATVACGDALRFLDKDRNVACDLTAGATKAKVVVTFDDKLVPTKWALDPKLLSKAKMEQTLTPSVREKTAPSVTVTCGSEPLVPRPADGLVWCEVADGDKKAKLKVEVDADLNIQRWDIAGA